MKRGTVKIIAILIVAALIVTSFSMLGSTVSFAEETNSESLPPESFGWTALTATSYIDGEPAPQLETLPLYMQYIREHYKDEVSEDLLIKGAFAGVMNVLNDPYSEFYSSGSEYDRFTEYALGEYEGVGIIFQLKEENYIVNDIMPNSPAQKSGIKPGDALISIDGTPLSGKVTQEIFKLLRGAAGSKVSLVIERKGRRLTKTMYREKIRQSNLEWNINKGNVGYIKISQFDSDTDEEFAKAREGLRISGINRFIIDLRNNPGGVIGTALGVLDGLMSDKNDLALISRRGKIIERFTSSGTGESPEKIVVLINGNTASAAEIVAAALKDNGMAQLVGARTFGKGVGQEIMRMSSGEAFKLSTMYFKSPKGNEIDKVGIEPDYPVVALGGRATAEEIEAIGKFAPMREHRRYWRGESGLNVYAAQQRLQMLGYEVKPTGVMDDATVSVVRSFQGTAGIYPYGVLDYTTITELAKYIELYSTGQLEMNVDPQYDKAVEILKKWNF